MDCTAIIDDFGIRALAFRVPSLIGYGFLSDLKKKKKQNTFIYADLADA